MTFEAMRMNEPVDDVQALTIALLCVEQALFDEDGRARGFEEVATWRATRRRLRELVQAARRGTVTRVRPVTPKP